MKRAFAIALLVAVAALGAPAAAADVAVRLEADETVVQIGETLTVQITVEGAGMRAPNVQMPQTDHLELAGRSSGSSISIVNGRTQASRTLTLKYRALKAGRVKVGPAKVKHKGRIYQSNVAEVRIVKAPQVKPAAPADVAKAGEAAFLDVELSAKEAYPGQEVTVSFFFYIRGSLRQANLVGEPSFPGAIPHKLAGGTKLNFVNADVGGQDYLVSPVARYVVYPIAPGEVTVDEFKLSVVTDQPGKDRFGNDIFDSFFMSRGRRLDLATPRKTIRVKPLPAEGRPEDFRGNVGAFKMTAELDKDRVPAGEAVTLAITVEGRGNTETLAPPVVSLPQGIKSFSQTSRDDSLPSFDTLKSRRIFETIIIPEEEGAFTIGPFDMAVFNPEKGIYERISAPAKNLVVEPGAPEADQAPKVLSKETIALAGKDIRTIKAEAALLSETSLPLRKRPAFWAVLAFAPFAFALRVRRVRRKERLAADVGLARRLHASKEAKRRLAKAKSALPGPAAAFGAELYKAVMGFVADQIAVEAPSLTASKAEEALRERGAGEENLRELAELLRAFDAMRYGGLDPAKKDRANLMNRVGHLIDRVHRTLQRGGGK